MTHTAHCRSYTMSMSTNCLVLATSPIFQSRLKTTTGLSSRRQFYQYPLFPTISNTFSSRCLFSPFVTTDSSAVDVLGRTHLLPHLPLATSAGYSLRRRSRSPPLPNYNQVFQSVSSQCSARQVYGKFCLFFTHHVDK